MLILILKYWNVPFFNSFFNILFSLLDNVIISGRNLFEYMNIVSILVNSQYYSK